MDLLSRYGSCVVPKGAFLYRMGPVNQEYGAFFALYPYWADDFRIGSNRDIEAWRITSNIELLFAIKHLKWNGLPVCALTDIYQEFIGPLESVDELDIKWRNQEAKTKLLTLLEAAQINGWLSTMENNRPLEVFLAPKALQNLHPEPIVISKTARRRNTLRALHIEPAAGFCQATRLHSQDDNYSTEEEDYSLLEKLFQPSLPHQ